jgi:hypothetical protein
MHVYDMQYVKSMVNNKQKYKVLLSTYEYCSVNLF